MLHFDSSVCAGLPGAWLARNDAPIRFVDVDRQPGRMMKMLNRIVVAAAAVALAALPSEIGAQLRTRQLQDARVRVTAPPIRPDKVTGQVTRFDTVALVVRDEATGTEQAFPLHSIQLLEISRGTTRGGSAGQRARLLAFVGGGLGAIAGALVQPFGEVGTSIAATGGAGALLGAGIGAAWGSSAPKERWEWAVRPWGYDPRTAPLPSPPPPAADTAAPPPAPADSAAPSPPPPPTPPPSPPPLSDRGPVRSVAPSTLADLAPPRIVTSDQAVRR
ncbi:MAG TPA: hypothetical protein VF092_25040 [Longimicrobium sp.]